MAGDDMTTTTNPPRIDFGDIQGLVRFGYGKLTDTCYFLVRIRDAAAAAAWLKSAPITDAALRDHAPEHAVQVAFTVSGLRAMAVPEEVVAGFSPEFLSGMADDPNRSRRLGDVGVNAPANWWWGTKRNLPHLVVLLFAREGQLAGLQRIVQNDHWLQGFEEISCLSTSDLRGFEPFGFIDGVSQPTIDWDSVRPANPPEQLQYGNLVAVGEFLLGYRNEYGKYTERPVVPASASGQGVLPPSEEDPQRLDIGRNGSYLVFRQLKQDVCGFWQYLNSQAQGDAAECTRYAEAMVGRKLNGDALLSTLENEIPGVAKEDDRNHFTYASDADGKTCPFGAHIRRANPRNGDISGADGILHRVLRTLGLSVNGLRDDLVASTRFHRILRRGREYGTLLSREDAIRGRDDAGDHGLYFICLNANISRQFEFVQNAWIMNSKFDGMSDEADPLLGNREPLVDGRSSDNFSLSNRNLAPQRLYGVPQFVSMVGGAYFFLPGIRALRYLAGFAR
jgi:Dyp-type peroxidase family